NRKWRVLAEINPCGLGPAPIRAAQPGVTQNPFPLPLRLSARKAARAGKPTWMANHGHDAHRTAIRQRGTARGAPSWNRFARPVPRKDDRGIWLKCVAQAALALPLARRMKCVSVAAGHACGTTFPQRGASRWRAAGGETRDDEEPLRAGGRAAG